MRKIKETEEGKKFEWIDCGQGSGFWSSIDDQEMQDARQPLTCPGCNGLLYNRDSEPYNRWGVCADCVVDWIEGRENLPDFKNNNKLVGAYVKEKIAEKAKTR